MESPTLRGALRGARREVMALSKQSRPLLITSNRRPRFLGRAPGVPVYAAFRSPAPYLAAELENESAAIFESP